MVSLSSLLQIHKVTRFSVSVQDGNVIYIHNGNTEQIIIKFGSGGSAVELSGTEHVRGNGCNTAKDYARGCLYSKKK